MYAHVWQIKLLEFSIFENNPPKTPKKQNKKSHPPKTKQKNPSKNKNKTKQSKKAPDTKVKSVWRKIQGLYWRTLSRYLKYPYIE